MKVFISYAHKTNRRYFKILKEKLAVHTDWDIWTDVEIEIGSDWHQQIQQNILQADVAILLVSAEFFRSDYIKNDEYNVFIQHNIKMLPILLSDCDYGRWETLSKTQFFVAYGEDYGLPKLEGEFIPFDRLCRFDTDGVLIPNGYIDTFIKNFVKKVNEKKRQA